MKRSEKHILTTHAGSLPRPDALRSAWDRPAGGSDSEALLKAVLRSSVNDVVKGQRDTGIDVPNDGEFGKPMRAAADLAAWGTYIFGRLSGFGPTPAGQGAPDRAKPGDAMRIVGERWEQREFADFYTQGATVPSTASRPACVAPIAYSGEAALRRDLANLKPRPRQRASTRLSSPRSRSVASRCSVAVRIS